MEQRNKQQRGRLEVEQLEDRLAPGTLMVTTPSDVITSHTLNSVVTGHLETAQAHTPGVITWTPGP